MLKHWAIASLSLRDKPPVGSQQMRSGGDQADREELREKAAWKKLASKRGACDNAPVWQQFHASRLMPG
jgi:hypothetical protein